MSLHERIERFTQSHALEPCRRDPAGRFVLYVDGHQPLFCYERGEGIIFLGDIASLPEGDFEKIDLLQRMMKIQFARCRHHREMLAYDRGRERLIVYRRIDGDILEDWKFEEILERFAAALTYWIEAAKPSPSSSRPLF